MARSSHSMGKRRREADRARQKQDKEERKRKRKSEGGGGIESIEIASVEDIQTAAVQANVDDVLADGTVVNREAAAGFPCRLFVGGLSWDTTAAELRETFATMGEVVDATIVTDRDTGDSRGFGFVTMANRKDASKAMRELSSYELHGRTLRIDMATER